MSRGVQIGIFIVILFIIIAIGAAITWWIINENPKRIYRGVKTPDPCAQTNPCNQAGPSNACSPHQCTFNPPGGGTTTCTCITSMPLVPAGQPVDEVILT